MSSTTLKNIKKGDTVILKMFTGCPTSVKKVLAADKDTITIETGRHGDTVFSRKTGKQIEPKPSAEKYASFIVEDDGSFVPPSKKKKAKPEKPTKKKVKKAKPEEDIDEDEYEDADSE